jgi:c-di-AMP phosphodiesterase-like protein
MRLDYQTVPENITGGFGYYFISFIVYIWNFCLIISNNYSILFICIIIVPICIYFNKLNQIVSCLILLTFIGRVLTYDKQHYGNENNQLDIKTR